MSQQWRLGVAKARTNGEKLREYREALGVTQAELAARAGLAHRAAISKRETGRVPVSRAELFHLCGLVEQIVAERLQRTTPAEVLGG